MRGSMLLLPFLTRILFPTAVQHHDAPLAPGQTFTGACLLPTWQHFMCGASDGAALLSALCCLLSALRYTGLPASELVLDVSPSFAIA